MYTLQGSELIFLIRQTLLLFAQALKSFQNLPPNSCCESVDTFKHVSVRAPLNGFLQLNRSKGRPTLQGVNTITISASCCCGGRRKQGVEERRRRREEDEREPARADRESQLWHDSDKLPCIYSNCVTWSFGWVVMCVFRDWPCWWANTNKPAKWRTDSELSGWSSDNQNIQLDDMNSKLKNTFVVSHK